MTQVKKIGILTSGGDCSGLNSVIRNVVFAANSKGWEVVGIFDATDGLFSRPMRYRDLKVADLPALVKVDGNSNSINETITSATTIQKTLSEVMNK